MNFKANSKENKILKNNLRHNFKSIQGHFDKRFRFYKRQHKKQELYNLEQAAKNDPSQMWAQIKKLCNPPSSRAALQIVRSDGSISHDMSEIFERWLSDISKLYSGLGDNPEFAFNDSFYEDILSKKKEFDNLSSDQQRSNASYNSDGLNSELFYQEVSEVIDQAKNGKAFQNIPHEALKNPNAKILLYNMFKICLSSGLNPTDWDFNYIKPIPKKGQDERPFTE